MWHSNIFSIENFIFKVILKPKPDNLKSVPGILTGLSSIFICRVRGQTKFGEAWQFVLYTAICNFKTPDFVWTPDIKMLQCLKFYTNNLTYNQCPNKFIIWIYIMYYLEYTNDNQLELIFKTKVAPMHT